MTCLGALLHLLGSGAEWASAFFARQIRSASATERENPDDEADIPAEPAPPREGPWVPRADEDERRPQGAEAPPGEGTQTADRVRLSQRFTRRERLTRGADFQTLFQRGKRIDRPALIVLWTDSPERRVGFTVSRQVRGAVKRNRVRRRLREAYRVAREAAPDQAAMVVIGRPRAAGTEFRGLILEMRRALEAIPGARAAARAPE